MYTALCFCGRNALYTVHTAFVLQCAIDIATCDGANDFLETSGSTFARTRYFQLPSFGLAIFGVHSEQVSCKQSSFVSACTAADFEYGVLCIFWILGYEHQFDGFFKFGNTCFAICDFFACHFSHFRIIFSSHQDIFAFFKISQKHSIFFACVHQILQILVFFGQAHISLLICDDRWVGDQS